jgi:hypothetical protein
MKSISSAIVIAVGMYGLIHSVQLSAMSLKVANGLGLLIAFLGSIIVTALGLVGWWSCLKYDR